MPARTLIDSRSESVAVRRARPLRPLDAAQADEPGPHPYRILAIGGRLLAGGGVRTHGLALTGAVARALARSVTDGISVRSVLIPITTPAAIERALEQIDLAGIDVVVVVADSPASLAEARRSLPSLTRCLQRLWQRITPGSSLVFAIAPPTAVVGSRDVREFAAEIQEGTTPLIRVVPLSRRPSGETPSARYAAWGEVIAGSIAESLIEPLAKPPVSDSKA